MMKVIISMKYFCFLLFMCQLFAADYLIFKGRCSPASANITVHFGDCYQLSSLMISMNSFPGEEDIVSGSNITDLFIGSGDRNSNISIKLVIDDINSKKMHYEIYNFSRTCQGNSYNTSTFTYQICENYNKLSGGSFLAMREWVVEDLTSSSSGSFTSGESSTTGTSETSTTGTSADTAGTSSDDLTIILSSIVSAGVFTIVALLVITICTLCFLCACCLICFILIIVVMFISGGGLIGLSGVGYKLAFNKKQVEDDVSFIEKIGEGSSGVIFKATYKNKTVAVKKIEIDSQSMTEAMREIDMMTSLPEHDNVVNIINWYPRDNNIFIIMKYYEMGSLYSLIHSKKLPLAMKLNYLIDTINGIKHLHDNNIVHRDIAARNVLVDEKGYASISDFGMSRKFDGDDNGQQTQNKILPIRSSAPESILKSVYSKSSDIYSIGILIFEILTQSVPFGKMNNAEILINVCHKDQRPVFDDTHHIPDTIKIICQKCWLKNPDQRPDIAEILQALHLTSDTDSCQINNSPASPMSSHSSTDITSSCNISPDNRVQGEHSGEYVGFV